MTDPDIKNDGTAVAPTIPGRIAEVLKRSPGEPVMSIRSGGRTTSRTARKFIEEWISVAAYLKAEGVERGSRVILAGANHPDWCLGYLGILSVGATAVPVDPQLSVAEYQNIQKACEPVAILAATKDVAWAQDQAVPGRVPVYEVGNPQVRSTHWPGTEPPWKSVDPSSTASIIFTSGTTGNPKGVMLSHRNFLSNADAIVSLGIVGASDHILGLLPLHHVYPFMVCFIGPLLAGGRVTFLNSLEGPEIVEAMYREKITILPGVPRLFALMLQAMEKKIAGRSRTLRGALNGLRKTSVFVRDRTGLNPGKLFFASVRRRFGSRFRFFASGGARLDPKTARGFESFGLEILEGYGLTETSPAAAFNRPGRPKRGSVGQAVPGVELRIGPAEGRGSGEILIRGPNVMQGYYRMPEETSAVLKDGWFRTGDLGRIDSDGYLYITGRSKEVIVLSSGKNVFPEDVEKPFLDDPLIEEICIFGPERAGGVEVVEALILPSPVWRANWRRDATSAREKLREAVRRIADELPPYQRPRGVHLVDEPLPRTPLGKLRRFQVAGLLERARRLEAETAPADGVRRLPLDREAAGKVQVELEGRKADPRRTVQLHHDLEFDLGIDSLGRVEILTALGLSNRPSDRPIRTVEDLIRAVEAGGGGPGAGWAELLARPPDPEDLGFMAGRRRETAVIRLLRKGVVGTLRSAFRFRVSGLEHLPPVGPAILAPNHESYLDGFLVGAAVPPAVLERLYTVGLEEFFRGPLSSVLTATAHVIPIDTGRHLERAMRMSAHVLRQGHLLSIFPEGGRTYDGELMEFRKGVGILAVELGVPVIPCMIDGAWEIWPRHRRLPRLFRPITLSFSEAIRPEHPAADEVGGDGRYRVLVDRLRERILEMKQRLRDAERNGAK